MIGASIQERIHTTSSTTTSGPSSPFLPPPPREPPPELRPQKMRFVPSRISTTAPTSAASVVISRTSRFLTWPSSWPITPCNSSRLQRSSSPWVTAT